MKRPSNYNTRQRAAILDYIASLGGEHVTAARIVEHFGEENIPVGRTTVYRHLERLTQSGQLRKYSIDGADAACFQYVRQDEACHEHLHLKCEHCGKLFHLSCELLDEMQLHFHNTHAFQLNAMKTVLYGSCETCARKAKE